MRTQTQKVQALRSLVVGGSPFERLSSAHTLSSMGDLGLEVLVSIAESPVHSSDARLAAADAIPSAFNQTRLTSIARGFLRHSDPVLQDQGLKMCVRSRLVELLPVVETLREDSGEFWDLDERIKIAVVAANAAEVLRRVTDEREEHRVGSGPDDLERG